jgi:cell shape-determining protein MreC
MKVRFFGVGILIVIILILSSAFLRRVIFSVVTPLWQGENAIARSIQYTAELFRSKNSLLTENINLKIENSRANSRLSVLDVLRIENEELKERLGRPRITTHSILAEILVKPGRTPYDTLIIDIGQDEGLNGGEMVLADGSVAIGKISEVFSSSAKVVLFSSPSEKTEVYVGEKAILTEAIGLGGGNFEASVPNGISVSVGDFISLPGRFSVIFGTVEELTSRPTDPSQTISFKLPVNMAELRYVDVVIGRTIESKK